jgi:hypothetical protein
MTLKASRQCPLFLLAEVVSRQGRALGSAKVKWWELCCFEYVAEIKVEPLLY